MTYCPWCAAVVERAACAGCARRVEPEWRVCPWCRHVRDAGPAAPAAPVHAAHRSKVLVVDDDESVLTFVAAALVDVCDVVPARTAEEALRIAATEDLDAMVLDLALPDLTGIEVTRLLRADTRTALLPLMLLTGSDDPLLRTEALHAGADMYLSKPVEPAALEATVTALIARSAVAAG
jgi:CheY-like chemotaxis protein